MKKKNEKGQLLQISFVYLFIAWTIIIVGIITWSYFQLKESKQHLAYKEGYKSYEKDLMFRVWATTHGGVYVPVTEATQPNPHLKIKDRDITTPSGRLYTLMNPAYMTRQVNELSFNKFGIISHITSLNPLRPQNKPDKWETNALMCFAKGQKEYYGIDYINGEKYFRYMAPLITTQGCMKCHADQGYKVGDIRGGLSTAVKWNKYQEAFNKQMLNVVIGYGVLWIIGLIGLSIVRNKFILYISEKKKAEENRNRLIDEISQTNQNLEAAIYQKNALIKELSDTKEYLEKTVLEKDKFFSIIAHDLKSPFAGFLGLTQILAEDINSMKPDELSDFAHTMQNSADSLYQLLENLLQWTRMQRGLISFNPENFLIDQLVKQIIDLQSEVSRKKELTVISTIPAETQIVADLQMINTVLRNLISNAIKFTPRGGIIEIGIMPGDKENQIMIFVKDNGIGIPKSLIDDLFKIDKKISRQGTEGESSTGLGLLLCKEFIENNSGKIWVISEENVGSTFIFTLLKKSL